MCSEGSFALHRPDGAASHNGNNWFDSSTAPSSLGASPSPGSVFSITLGYPELKGPTDTCLAVPQSPQEVKDGVQYYIKQTCESCPDFVLDMYDASHANPLRGDLGSGAFPEPGLFVMDTTFVGVEQLSVFEYANQGRAKNHPDAYYYKYHYQPI